MPFNSSYDPEDAEAPPDAREFFRRLAMCIIREPLATHIVRVTTSRGKAQYLVIDRSAEPREGSRVVVADEQGLCVTRYLPDTPREWVWGTVVWFLQEG